MKPIRKVLMLLGNYDSAAHRGIARAARQFGWHLNVSMLTSFQIPDRWQGDGIICSLNANTRLTQYASKTRLPCVDLSIWRNDISLPRVAADNLRIGELAARHFHEQGHQRFGWFSTHDNPVAAARCEGFKRKLTNIHPVHALTGKATENRKQVKAWLSKLEPPAALFCFNDTDAAWLLNLCLELDYRIPDDFAIVGVDNNELVCEHQPVPLSSVNHDLERIGFEGADLLQRLMNGEAPPGDIHYIEPTGITVRASSDALAVGDPLVRDALAYLQENLREAISTTHVAAAVGTSRRNLEIRFKETLQCGIHQKLLELRLKQAEHMLINSEQKIEDIAALTGFCHAPHFCRAFKNSRGRSPLVFRKARRNN